VQDTSDSTREFSFSSPVNYSEDLASVMKKMILVSEVAYLAKTLRRTSRRVVVPDNVQSMGEELYSSNRGKLSPFSRGDGSDTRSDPPVGGYLAPPEESDDEEMKKQMSSSTQMEIKDMLGEWEEPELREDVHKVSGLVPKLVAR
jgi:hypothetical protein